MFSIELGPGPCTGFFLNKPYCRMSMRPTSRRAGTVRSCSPKPGSRRRTSASDSPSRSHLRSTRRSSQRPSSTRTPSKTWAEIKYEFFMIFSTLKNGGKFETDYLPVESKPFQSIRRDPTWDNTWTRTVSKRRPTMPPREGQMPNSWLEYFEGFYDLNLKSLNVNGHLICIDT